MFFLDSYQNNKDYQEIIFIHAHMHACTHTVTGTVTEHILP